MSRCPCEDDVYAPECREPSPLGLAPHPPFERVPGSLPFYHCTRSEGHEGDHVRCTGGWPLGEKHEVERWPQAR